MKNFSVTIGRVWVRAVVVVLGALGLCACSLVGKPSSPPPAFYALEGELVPTTQQVPGAVPAPTLTLIINPPTAASGFDSPRIVYVREVHQLEYFAHSEWVDPPARMLGPLLVSAAQNTGAFAAVVLASGTAAGELRLSTDILKLQHNFQSRPSRVQLTLRVYLTDEKTRHVLAWKEFSGDAPATSDTPQGGVTAANVLVQDLLSQVAQFLVDRLK
jgi:cholesterol transport system auxiliary component